MIHKTFSSGRLREVKFDPREQHLELTWDNKSITAFRPVPREVVDRLCHAPNASVYFEDRILEEYINVAPRRKTDSETAAKKLNDLFGG